MEDPFWKCLLLLFVWILETQPLPGKTTKPNITILWIREASRTWTPWVWLWCFSLGFWVSPCSLVVGVILGEDHLCVLSDWQGCVHKSLLAIRGAIQGKKSSPWQVTATASRNTGRKTSCMQDWYWQLLWWKQPAPHVGFKSALLAFFSWKEPTTHTWVMWGTGCFS